MFVDVCHFSFRMKEERLKKTSDGASDVFSWVSKSRKLEEKKKAEREKALHFSKMFEERVSFILLTCFPLWINVICLSCIWFFLSFCENSGQCDSRRGWWRTTSSPTYISYGLFSSTHIYITIVNLLLDTVEYIKYVYVLKVAILTLYVYMGWIGSCLLSNWVNKET